MTLDGELRIEYIRVIRTSDGRLIVAMPSQKNSAGAHRDLVHPIVGRLRAEIDAAVINEFEGLTQRTSTVNISDMEIKR